MTKSETRAPGAALERIDGPLKVSGRAAYAAEYQLKGLTYAYPVQATIARGRVASIDDSAARALPGVVSILSHENAPHLDTPDNANLAVLQSDRVAYHGQIVAAVVAETLEVARQAAGQLVVNYAEEPHDVELRIDRQDFYKPDRINPNNITDTASGDVEGALVQAAVKVDLTYTTPTYHNNPLEPHATIAVWQDNGLTLYDANQGSHRRRDDVTQIFDLPPELVRVISPYVGGAFGGKAFTHPHVMLAIMAAKVARRPVKVSLTRQQMFALVGNRTPTIQRIQLGAEQNGRLTAIAHDVHEQTATVREFAEQTALATRMMYAAPNRRTTHRLARLDVPAPTFMRAPGECPGMFALESAMDEMASACGLDPIEFRILNEPTSDPESGLPFSTRGLVACLREGAQRFGWQQRDPRPHSRSEGRWLVGLGVAASTYPARRRGSKALIRTRPDGNYSVQIDATDLGTGAWTILTQIAADALGVGVERVKLEIGDSQLPEAPMAGGSMGTTSWGAAIVEAAQNLQRMLREEHNGIVPPEGLEVRAETSDNPNAQRFSLHSYGAQFVEARVNIDTGEVRIPRMLGVFAVGRIINAKTARSQLLGGMTMGLSMALHEHSVIDPRFGDYVNHDFASYHIATNADVGSVEVAWIDEDDQLVSPMGAKGIGEIGIVGTAAAVANAVYHATGIRVRDLPITLDKLLA
ncbi:xanthine dehydrogenase family protein molybdopterin-binding subunit [Ktedonosporobacter rubrisoli]|uniref:Xanthine dehydrogenase family protein molybdopterin-binding subunit n=1 Tax=Ktedonosporobacter rubrisoli TaxID=2509675 RepID=A0A4P6JVB1_KTERU|nr:xanthine dehydrogenase family protein molybdopterin-binding subunit [Ktedonosporobacter rubrisoli]QBD79587.1 xanthine dehydrogenase family protein molybdopterin-binding subunit [Ktedonosporobacter rubrisoli]